ncbi:Putative phosphoserine phosphatase 2 [Nocardioides dokdonensis FR1436]|uniref:Putative phosphoserine phosphatase 2 n=1 Tax=Nocardioides dokdonensis FR1436 TaxID=1300347 RepID=A0A1A9GPU0_9ACTN|nr:histidine phosphatase family protein [Nocardioides dokdonensis]ANH39680.1 Putative phosphoserine phosphatase 2 [Nocardioides dokdonensis FR1436]
MRTLHLVTHPEATHVVDGLVGGWYDADLTERGRVQAEAVAGELATRLRPALEAGERVAVASSDLLRCRRTAELVAAGLGRASGRSIPVELDEGLREQSYGAAEGRPVGTFTQQPPRAGIDPLRHRDGVPGSETRLEVATRVHAVVHRLCAGPAEHLVVVTHGGAATYVVTAWIGMPLDSVGSVRFVAPPGSISTLREDATTGDRRVEVLGDRRHLEVC